MIEEHPNMQEQPAFSDVLIAGLSKGLNLNSRSVNEQELLQPHWVIM